MGGGFEPAGWEASGPQPPEKEEFAERVLRAVLDDPLTVGKLESFLEARARQLPASAVRALATRLGIHRRKDAVVFRAAGRSVHDQVDMRVGRRRLSEPVFGQTGRPGNERETCLQVP
jgi:hypothetical protein